MALNNRGGKSLNDRKLASDVRKLSLTLIQSYLQYDGKDKKKVEYKQQLLLRLAPNLLPKLNEHSGVDGEPISVSLISFDDYNTEQSETGQDEG